MMCPDCGKLRHKGDCEPPDTEILAHDVARSVARYIAAAEKDPEGASREWSNLADVYSDLGKFLVRTRTRRVA